ncbi:hypothetical protein M3Y98_00222300 [Aphelenchoides besseyi]|nr:hypothetical protein M3Y98_00222300 [Aphelenchoides besseyi]KAI6200491.1 hypothetical protein M3Y96_00739800 [Aphelenchoides besseyi]
MRRRRSEGERMLKINVYLISVLVLGILSANAAVNRRNTSVVESEDESWAVNTMWTVVERRVKHSDLIRPTICPVPCERLFHAQYLNQTLQSASEDLEADTSKNHCYCQCSSANPVFNQETGECVSTIDSCQRPIRVASNALDSNSQWVPVVRLPSKGEFLRFNGQILWQESRVKVKSKFGARCNVTSARYLRQEPRWLEMSLGLLVLGWSEEQTAGIYWNGTDEEKDLLTGSLVQIRFDCVGAESNSHCMSFRISGQLLYPNYSQQFFGPASNRVETTVFVTLFVILLLLSAVVYGVLWRIRWRMKKSKLISSLQLQFLYHMKQQEKEKQPIESSNAIGSPYHYLNRTHHHYQALAAAHAHQQQLSDLNPESTELQLNVQQPIITKRKLYFSAEFFEPQHMQNPPPMAEQFIQDLRQLILIAKQRIKMRTHIQHLAPIAEEPLEAYQPYMNKWIPQRQASNEAAVTKTPQQNVTSSASIRIQPKAKTNDQPPRTESPDRKSNETIVEKQENQLKEEKPRKRPVDLMPPRKIPTNESSNTSTGNATLNHVATGSRIPVANGMSGISQKSPRILHRPLSTPGSSNNSHLFPPPLPARNPPSTPPKSLQMLGFQALAAQPTASETTPGHSRTAEARRKDYAVFPTTTLKKSLPRRSKNRPTTQQTAAKTHM